MADEVTDHWSSHDRFAAKRLHTVATGLVGEKRRIIEEGSAFRALLNVSPFNIPNGLIDFVAANTSPALREFKLGKKKIVFTREMVRKVIGIQCGNMPVVVKKGEHPELRKMYIGAGQTRPFIQNAIDLLKKYAVTDDLTIVRTWDLLCLATVVDPGSANCLNLEYLDCLLDPRSSDQYAWDKHLLELTMKEVTKINTKANEPLIPANAKKYEFWITGPFALLDIPYMHHLEFPPNQHAINYSTPRVCFVTSDDFKFIEKNDADRKMLNNKTVFGRRPFLPLADTPYGVVAPVAPQVEQIIEEPEVNPSASLNEWLVFPTSQDLQIPAKFKHLHEKHKVLYGIDIDTTLKNFGIGLKQMHSQRMVALLIDVDEAIKNEDIPPVDNVDFPTCGGVEEAQDIDLGDAAEGTVNDANVDAAGGPVGHLGDSEETEDAEVLVAGGPVGHLGDSEETEDAEDLFAADDDNVHTHSNVLEKPQSAVLVDSNSDGVDVGEQVAVDSPLRSPRTSPYKRIPEGISVEEWNRAPDPPSFDLWSQSEDPFATVPSNNTSVENQTVESSDNPADVDDKAQAGAHSAEAPSNKPADLEAQAGAHSAEAPPQHPIATASDKPVETDVPSEVPSLAMEAYFADALSPQHPSTGVVTKDASAGINTIEKQNRFKRAAKGDLETPAVKKIKVSQDVVHKYDKFVQHSRKFKRKKASGTKCKEFVRIGRFHYSFKGFQAALLPRKYMSNEEMAVWSEKFNHASKSAAGKTKGALKRYVFSPYFTERLVVDTSIFDPATVMKEFKLTCSKMKILKDDLLYFPIVQNKHWIVCCINICYKQFHVFDSLLLASGVSSLDKAANNLFSNFIRTANESKLSNIPFPNFKHYTPKHPRQETLYDCGFFSILFMEHFTGKVMPDFNKITIPDMRRLLVASLIDNRDNQKDDIEAIMNEDLLK